MIRAFRFRLASVPIALAFAAALPSGGLAQFGGTMDLRSGPVAWDKVEGGNPLLNGEVAGSYRFRPLNGLRPELLGRFGVSTGPDARAAMGYDLGVQLHTTGGGMWLGGAIGAAGNGSSARALTRLEGGVRRSLGPARIEVWLARTGFGGRIVSGGGLNQDSAGTGDTLARRGVSEYTDVGSRVLLSLSRYEVGLALTRRIGGGFSRRSGWELSGTWWAAPNVGVVGATGHSLSQFGLSLPGGRFGTVGLRLAVGARSAAAPARQSSETRPVTPTLAVSHRRLTVHWAPARTAEVMGDFTDWEPRPLVPLGAGRWTLPAELTPGVHHLHVRFDSGPWLVPAGAAAVDDGFGGRVGLVVVR
ncbi:MAG TPA: glycogen-binding domain-containing protein [Gemmatimonadales bacterium]|nr:glycogen-binding domain-containing protein [Gemmatimonadales bacterium]